MIAVDLANLMPHEVFGLLSEGMTEALLDSLAASARVKWIKVAQEELHSSRQVYIEGIQEVESQPGIRLITLEGWLANAIEGGLSGWDLRETVIGGKATHYTEDGHGYVHVPFRHGTPGTTGLVGAAMGTSYGPRGPRSLAAGGLIDADRVAQFGKDIYDAAKKLRTKARGRPAGAMREGTARRAFAAAGGRGEPLLRPHHTKSIYAGMRRERKPYVARTGRVTTQSQYMTWRTISETGGDPASWWHPGIEARNLSDQVQAHVERITPTLVERLMRSATRGA